MVLGVIRGLGVRREVVTLGLGRGGYEGVGS